MKLFYCPLCCDVIKLINKKRFCKCKKSYGKLIDKLDNACEIAYINNIAVPIAFDNNYIRLALQWWERDKRTSFLHGWTIDPTQPMNGIKIIKNKIN